MITREVKEEHSIDRILKILELKLYDEVREITDVIELDFNKMEELLAVLTKIKTRVV